MRVKGSGRGQRNASRPSFTVTYYGQPMKMPESVCLGPVVKSVPGPGCVKTLMSRGCVELFAQLPSTERGQQYI
jgi:hypothetical protein